MNKIKDPTADFLLCPVVFDLTCTVRDILVQIELAVGWDCMSKMIKALGF